MNSMACGLLSYWVSKREHLLKNITFTLGPVNYGKEFWCVLNGNHWWLLSMDVTKRIREVFLRVEGWFLNLFLKE